jgi:uncharacterized repeat protein (TIGR01451 family)
MYSYAKRMTDRVRSWRRLLGVLAFFLAVMWGSAAQAQAQAPDCGQAAVRGTAPDSWQTYCWLDLAGYDDAAARSGAGQNLSFALPDGSILRFNVRVTGGSGRAYNAVTAPSWSGAAVGNTAFIGIPGRPVLYTASAGTRTITLSGITLIPPAGATASIYSFIVADGESSNQGESLRLTTNGGQWQLLDTVPPISGSNFPGISGVGSASVEITGRSGTVGAHILGSSSPSSVNVQTVAGGLQGIMFAVRFASIRLQKAIIGSRVSASDQFRYEIVANGTGAVIASGTTSGSGSGPFSIPPLVMSAGVPMTLRETMAPGSASTLGQYASRLTCVNTEGPTRSSLPNDVAATSFNLGELQFGEALVCTFTNGALPRLRVRKALDGDRRFRDDQFTVRIMQGETVIAASTTTGSVEDLDGGDTGLVQLEVGQSYAVDEIAAGTANLGNYDAELDCSNATSSSGTSLPDTLPGIVVPQIGDVITCVIINEALDTAVLEVEKSSTVISDPVNGAVDPKAIPGAIVEYTIEVRNVGRSRVDRDTISITDFMPEGMAFATGTPITFVDGDRSSRLDPFDPATMVGFSSQPDGTGPFDYTPTGSFDPNVRAIRISPEGRMERARSGTVQPSFSIRFRARVE